ncbi:MAG: hypothetical protein HN964_04305 [Candidatus Jacksonbacteria bacterium]|jgi:sugar-specific transcriptional regulator TrmB|nr:hypothetical protein [Candidatus Jacksonbacteria bacterium]MBT7008646.1 hypothetical protein [Candidatus Jacksonbacteria bacterium]
MPVDELQSLGLSLNEAKIYETLLDLKESNVADIVTSSKIHRRNVYDTLNRLIDKGLVFPILTKGQNFYSPVDPDKLVEVIQEKQETLGGILPGLKKRYEARESTQEAYIYKGIEGYKNYIRDIIRVGEDGYFIGAKLGWFDDRIAPYEKQLSSEIKKKNLTIHNLFDYEVKEKYPELIERKKEMGWEYRFLPKEYSTNSAIDIFGDYVVTFTGLGVKKIADDVTLFVLRDRQLADSYRTWFKFMFNACKKESGTDTPTRKTQIA